MKKILIFFAFIPLLYACQENELPSPQQQVFVRNLSDSMEFILTPLSNEKFVIWFWPQPVALRNLLIMDPSGDTVRKEIVRYNEQLGFESAEIEFPFDPSQTYSLIVQSRAIQDTIYSYELPSYQHNYQGGFRYEKMVDLHGDVVEYDISPSRNTIFMLDYTNELNGLEPFILKKYSVVDQSVQEFSDTSAQAFIRAINDNVVLLGSHYYQERFLLSDSLSLRKLDLTNYTQTFIDWGSSGYGRFSRVIDNRIMVTNPIWTTGTYSLINLEDLKKYSYGISNSDYVYIREYNWDHMYFNNTIVNPDNGSQQPIPFTDNWVVTFDESKEYALSVRHISESQNQMEIYRLGELIYTGETAIKRRIDFSGVFHVRNNKILFHQFFDFSKEYRYSGFYEVDLEDMTVSLVQNDHTPFYMNFEAMDENLYSIRPDGLYQLTRK